MKKNIYLSGENSFSCFCLFIWKDCQFVCCLL